MKTAILAAIEDITPLFEDVTTSDLQGITEARAFNILKGHGHPTDSISILQLSDEILDGIYSKTEGR